MSTPAEHHVIDPVSEKLGRLDGRMDGLEKRLDSVERTLLWGFGITWTLIVASGLLQRVHG